MTAEEESVAAIARAEAKRRYLLFAKGFYTFYYAAFAFLSPYLALYYSDLGLDGGQIGVLRGIGPLIAVVAAPLWGALADLTGRHKTIRSLAIVGTWLAVLGLALGRGYGQLLAFAFLFAVFSAPVTSLVDNAVIALLGQDRARYGQQRLWGAVGWGAGGWVSGLIIERLGVTSAFVGYLGLLLVTGVLGLGIPSSRRRGTDADRADGEPGDGRDTGLASYLPDLRRLVGQRSWLLFLIASLLGTLYLGVETSYLFLYLRDLGASESLMGAALAVMTVAEIPVWGLAPRLLRRLGASGLLAISLAAGIVQALCYSILQAPWVALPLQLLHGLAFSAMWTAGVAYAADIAPPGTEATAQSVQAAVSNGLGRALGAYAGGLLISSVGGASMFRLTALTSSAALLLLLVSSRLRQRRRLGRQ
jgi:PPP family 3-phenylpropionic acid transporter